MSIALLFLGASILPFIAASPALPTPTAPPSPTAPTKTYKYRRDILSSLAGDTNSILSELGSAIPSYVASGVPNFFQDFPTGTAVQSSLSLESSAIAALPTQVLNIPCVTPSVPEYRLTLTLSLQRVWKLDEQYVVFTIPWQCIQATQYQQRHS